MKAATAAAINAGKKVDIEPQAYQQSRWRTILFDLAANALTSASTEGVQNGLFMKEALVNLSGIWDTYNQKNNTAFGQELTAKALDACRLSEIQDRDPQLQKLLDKLIGLHLEGKCCLHLAEEVMDRSIQDTYPDFKEFLGVLRIIFRHAFRPSWGSEPASEADYVFLWTSILREGLPINTALNICLGEQGCRAAALSKSELSQIFNTGTTTRRCDVLLKVAGLEVGNFEAKRMKSTQDEVVVQRLKNQRINKSIQIALEAYKVDLPPLLNIQGCDASLFRVVKFHDIWVAGPAADAIVLPTTHEEILFFLESSAHTLHNLIRYLDMYATSVLAAKRRFDYERRKSLQSSSHSQPSEERCLEWERVVFHSPSKHTPATTATAAAAVREDRSIE
ncbi:hypothetical protein BGZ96_006497 [Linnemannia gamsii]|uniref:Uncharacterized protein n=1 Tax=Linnemannia gamsii TaxID=64522 RepID=A0ABQ7K2P8_9FUNG|nr:hypothetical protein BGZ96_006497 [Linnemannia gamsii]